jgi:hypothetical protein
MEPQTWVLPSSISARTAFIKSCDCAKKTSFTATPKRIFKFLGRLINRFSHFFQVISLDFCGQSTFRIPLEIGNFNLRRVAASLTFHWELSVAKEIRVHFRKHSTLGPAFLSSFRKPRSSSLSFSQGNALWFALGKSPKLLCCLIDHRNILISYGKLSINSKPLYYFWSKHEKNHMYSASWVG